MPRQIPPSIPFELHQLKAQQIFEKRIANGAEGSPETDWEQAKIELENNRWGVKTWKIKKLFVSNCRRLWLSFSALLNVIGKIITVPFWLPFKLHELFADADTRPFALDVVKTIATFIAAIGLFITYQNALLDRQLVQEKLITERFTKAVEQTGDSKKEVIVGGIYSLEKIANDSAEYQWTVMEFLTTFIRKKSPSIISTTKSLDDINSVSIEVQAALTVIGRRDSTQDNIPEDKIIKQLDLSNSNLKESDLRESNLSNVNLSRTNLSNTKLTNTNLSNANLSGADLSNANLSNADLSGANLSNTYLTNTNLSNANLSGADLSNANLRKANLRNSNLSGTKFSDNNLSLTDFRGVNLGGFYLNGFYMYGANLSDTNLNNSNLSNADLRNAILNYANLSNSNLSYAKLNNAILNNANLSNSDLSYADLNNLKLIRADLNDSNLSYAKLSNAKLNLTNLSNANLSNADLSNNSIVSTKLINANLTGVNLNDTNFSTTKIKSACFWAQAIYTDSDWDKSKKRWIAKDEQANQQKIENIRKEKATKLSNPPDCN